MKCPICEKKCIGFMDARQQIEYYECSACRYIFKSPRHHWELPKQKARYDLHENNADDPGYRAYFQRFLDFISSYLPHSGSALDFGSGASDLLSSMLMDVGYDTSLYDPIYYPDKSYTDEKYDLIVSTEVFEHLDDPLGTMKHLARLLDPQGLLAIQTQFHPQDRGDFLEWYYRLDPTHIGFFTPDTFRYMARLSGLEYISDDNDNKVILQNQ